MSASSHRHGEREFSIRTVRPTDAPHVERLIREGLLPDRVDYESTQADNIRKTLGTGRERFFVAESNGRLIGTLAIVEARPDVGHLHWLRVDPAWQGDLVVARTLMRVATQYAREVGFLKLAIHAPAEIEQRVRNYYHELGFEFSRARDLNGVHVLEFYVNLYVRPKLRED